MKALRVTPALLALGIVSVLAAHPSTPTVMAPSQGDAAKQKAQPPSIERLDPALDKLLAPDAKIEILAEGYEWSEGPIWVKNGGFLLFSDVLKNTVHRWKQGEGAKPYLTPSGTRATCHAAAKRAPTGSPWITRDVLSLPSTATAGSP